MRALKALRNEMEEKGVEAAKPITGFLIECLVWNIPNSCFGNLLYTDDVRECLVYIYI